MSTFHLPTNTYETDIDFKKMNKILSKCPLNKIKYLLSETKNNAQIILNHLKSDELENEKSREIICPFLKNLNKNNGEGYFYGEFEGKNINDSVLNNLAAKMINLANEIGLSESDPKDSKTIILSFPNLDRSNNFITKKNHELLNIFYLKNRNIIKETNNLLFAALHPDTTSEQIIINPKNSETKELRSNKLLQVPIPSLMLRNIVRGDIVFPDEQISEKHANYKSNNKISITMDELERDGEKLYEVLYGVHANYPNYDELRFAYHMRNPLSF